MRIATRVRPFAAWRDVAMGGAGIAAMTTLLAGVRPAPAAALIMAAVAALFAVLLLRALVRLGRRVTVENGRLTCADRLRRRSVDLGALRAVRLDYYPGMFDRTRGLFVLRLADRKARLTLDSELEDFRTVVQAVRAAGREGGVALSERSRANLEALESRPDRSP